MAELILEGLGKTFGPLARARQGMPRRGTSRGGDETWAVRDLSLVVREGEFLTLLGPSGCGKTTTLRMIAGFVAPTTGRVLLGGRVLSSAAERLLVPPERRDMGMVFQSYAVWPHLTAAQNVAFPLRHARVDRAAIEARTRRVLSLVHLEPYAARYPHELSGGQQQRIALARALVMEPAVLLLDEPLSNLDAKLREELRAEIKELHERLGITVVYVTHDQGEAMALSGRIAVLLAGRVMQVGAPQELYERPADPAVASLVGAANFLPGVVERRAGPPGGGQAGVRIRLLDGAGAPVITVPDAAAAGGRVLVCIRPEALEIAPGGALRGRVIRSTYLGNRVDCLVEVGTHVVRVEMPSSRRPQPGEEVTLAVRRAVVYPEAASAATSSGDRTT